jgi:hypothetical protein
MWKPVLEWIDVIIAILGFVVQGLSVDICVHASMKYFGCIMMQDYCKTLGRVVTIKK